MIVELERVSKKFGTRTAVDAVDLQVPAGSCFGLLGPNGAGKTTSLRMIYGVTQPTSGTIRVFGRDLAREARAIRARLGVTLQDNVFIEALSPVENLRVFGRYHLIEEPALSRRVDELVDFLELRSHADMPVRTLSGGFQRRLAIAMSLINRPELLILDEPTTGLDPAVRLALWGRIRDLRAQGTTILLTTHYMDEAQRLCDRIAVMAAGTVVDVGSPAELIQRHVEPVAVELDCAVEDEAEFLAATGGPKHLRSGNRLLVYLADAEPLLTRLGHDESRRRSVIVRPANLEDVFLALTGTRLE
jgi:lipooligosaccharide transport system ATP-binding protein